MSDRSGLLAHTKFGLQKRVATKPIGSAAANCETRAPRIVTRGVETQHAASQAGNNLEPPERCKARMKMARYAAPADPAQPGSPARPVLACWGGRSGRSECKGREAEPINAPVPSVTIETFW